MKPDDEKSRPVVVPYPVKSERVRQALSWAEKDVEKLLEEFPEMSPSEQLELLPHVQADLRQELIVSSPYAAELVSRMPEEEVYITLKEIGLDHAAPLLALLTPEQDRFLGDLELWKKDEFEAERLLEFVGRMRECSEDRLARWLEAIDPELIALTLRRHGRVDKFDVFRDPVEASDEGPFIAHDGLYRFYPRKAELFQVFEPILRILFARDPQRYGAVMESAYADQTAEVEEEALKWREDRLAEKGFPPPEEATWIYRPLSKTEFNRLVVQTPVELGRSQGAPAVRLPVLRLARDSLLFEALALLALSPEHERIQTELAVLANKVLAADGLELRDVDALRRSLSKVSGVLTIALQMLAGNDAQKAAAWLRRSWLHFLFRLGYGQVDRLARRARKLLPSVRFRWADRYHYLPDPPLEETLLGLARPRPVLAGFAPTGEPGQTREFQSIDDLRSAEDRLILAETLCAFFSNELGLPPDHIKEVCIQEGHGDHLDTVRWSQVLCTLWARRIGAGAGDFLPLLPGQVRRFLDAAFESRREPNSVRRLRPEALGEMLSWCDRRLADTQEPARSLARNWIDQAVTKLAEELGGLSEEAPIDGRFLTCLCVKTVP